MNTTWMERADMWAALGAAAATCECEDTKPTLVSPGNNEILATDLARVRFCGRTMYGVAPETGDKYKYRYACGKWRLCPWCAQKRADKEQQRLVDVFGVGAAFVATGSEADMKKLTNRLQDKAGAGCYRRYPLADGSVTILHNVQGETGNETDVADLDWAKLTATPERRSISGKLKSTVTETKQEDNMASKRIQVRTVAPNIPDGMRPEKFTELVDDAFELAVLKTAHLDPDLETIELCMAARQDAFELQLRAVDLDVKFSVVKYLTVKENEIDWKPLAEKIKRKRSIFSGLAFKDFEEAKLFDRGGQPFMDLKIVDGWSRR